MFSTVSLPRSCCTGLASLKVSAHSNLRLSASAENGESQLLRFRFQYENKFTCNLKSGYYLGDDCGFNRISERTSVKPYAIIYIRVQIHLYKREKSGRDNLLYNEENSCGDSRIGLYRNYFKTFFIMNDAYNLPYERRVNVPPPRINSCKTLKLESYEMSSSK